MRRVNQQNTPFSELNESGLRGISSVMTSNLLISGGDKFSTPNLIGRQSDSYFPDRS